MRLNWARFTDHLCQRKPSIGVKKLLSGFVGVSVSDAEFIGGEYLN